MKTGSRGTFVISWAQTELDGQWSAPLASLRVGTVWSWAGEPVRVDGPADILPLGEAIGAGELRRRAARKVRRLLQAVETGLSRLDDLPQDDDPATALRRGESGFAVTDGRDTWTVTLIEPGPGKPPLALFVGEAPPRQTDLWVVSHNIDLANRDQMADVAGGVICFTPGTAILTDTGPRPVEDLREGDRLQTKDNGYAPVLWIGQRRVSGARMHAMPHLRPVRLRAGALDAGVPDAGLLVSPDHRILLRGARPRALFNCDELLVTARDLVNDRSVVIDHAVREVTYIHLLLPQHQIVFANAVETESFHPASAGLATMEDTQLAQLLDRLPDIASDPQSYGGYARRVLSASEAAILQHDLALRRVA